MPDLWLPWLVIYEAESCSKGPTPHEKVFLQRCPPAAPAAATISTRHRKLGPAMDAICANDTIPTWHCSFYPSDSLTLTTRSANAPLRTMAQLSGRTTLARRGWKAYSGMLAECLRRWMSLALLTNCYTSCALGKQRART